MLLYFLRHGDPIYEPDQLTEKGKTQAEALSRRLLLSQIDEIYASSSVRACQTAQPLADKLHKEICKMDWCHENLAHRDFSITDEDGQRRWFFESESFLRRMGQNDVAQMGFEWYRHPLFADTKCGEGYLRIARHTDEFLASLGYLHDTKNHCYTAAEPNEKRIALFAHGGFGRAFLAHIMDIPLPYFVRFMNNHSGMTVIRFSAFEDGITFPKLLMFSGDGHLYKEGLPTTFNNGILL